MKRILWPEVCPFCGKASVQGICLSCQETIKCLIVQEPKCMKCGRALREMDEEYCIECRRQKPLYERGVSLWQYEPPISESLYHFKFYNQREFSLYYGKLVAKYYGFLFQSWEIHAIFPIPLHKSRRKQRGFNQAHILAREVAKATHAIYKSFTPIVTERVLLRVKKTKPQKQLGFEERRRNLASAFEIDHEMCERIFGAQGLKGKVILLVDDIFTTGSTVDAATRVLLNAGASRVYFFTLSTVSGNMSL